MKLYIVYQKFFGTSALDVCGIFSSEEKAKKYIEKEGDVHRFFISEEILDELENK